jgi:glycosyltransferase involved in cell wall biosynthesis
MTVLIEILTLVTAISVIIFAALSIYTGFKFFLMWQAFREESLFHLATLSFGMLLYFAFLELIILWNDVQIVNTIIEKGIPIVFSLLCLELSLFYLALFSNRKTLWEKYVPYFLGASLGTAIALLGLSSESNPWYWSLLFLTYGISVVLISILSLRLILRVISLMKNENLTKNVDKRFLQTILYSTILLFGGSIIDILIFQYVTFTDVSVLLDFFAIGGLISPPFAVLAIHLVRKFFNNVENADVVHLMNLLS